MRAKTSPYIHTQDETAVYMTEKTGKQWTRAMVYLAERRAMAKIKACLQKTMHEKNILSNQGSRT